MNQRLNYFGQLPLVETNKHNADQKRELAFLDTQVWDNKRGMNNTTNGNEWSRLKKNVAYWEAKREVKREEITYVNDIIVDDQNTIIQEFKTELEEGTEVCTKCFGNGEIVHFTIGSSNPATYSKCENCDHGITTIEQEAEEVCVF